MLRWLFKKNAESEPSVKKCMIYSIGNAGLILPTSGKLIFVYEGDTPKFYLDFLSSDEEVSETLYTALSHSEYRPKSVGKVNYAEVNTMFETAMDEFREKLGIGQKKFQRELSVLDVDLEDDELVLWPNKPAHGKYAFEGVCKAEDRPRISKTAAVSEQVALIRENLRIH